MNLGFESSLFGHFMVPLEELDNSPPALDVMALPFRNMPPFPIESIIEWSLPDFPTVELVVEQYLFFGGLEVLVKWRDHDAVHDLFEAIRKTSTPLVIRGRRLIVPQEYCMSFDC